MKIKNAVICAAGLGSRLGLDMPKCLVPLASKPLIYYLLKSLEGVENVRVVVGFKEDLVIDTVRKIRQDVVFVRNPEYMRTTNAYSLYLGSHDLNEPFLNIDGDMYISRHQLLHFDSQIVEGQDLIGVTKSYTEDAVFVKLNEKEEAIEFSRDKISDLEWTGIAYFANVKIRKNGGYVYQELESKLPIKACQIACYEIDTPADLEYLTNNIQLDEE
jgi:choline kinase